jgi:hypothetical protein
MKTSNQSGGLDMNKKSNIVIGGIFVLLGGMFLLKNLNVPGFYFNIFDLRFLIVNLWPSLFLILPAVIMHQNFFSRRTDNAGILVPGGILLVVGVTLQLITTFHIERFVWPGFILAVAVGLYELYLFGGREKGILIPVVILGGISGMFFLSSLRLFIPFGHLLLPLLLILLGVVILFKRPSRRDF